MTFTGMISTGTAGGTLIPALHGIGGIIGIHPIGMVDFTAHIIHITAIMVIIITGIILIIIPTTIHGTTAEEVLPITTVMKSGMAEGLIFPTIPSRDLPEEQGAKPYLSTTADLFQQPKVQKYQVTALFPPDLSTPGKAPVASETAFQALPHPQEPSHRY